MSTGPSSPPRQRALGAHVRRLQRAAERLGLSSWPANAPIIEPSVASDQMRRIAGAALAAPGPGAARAALAIDALRLEHELGPLVSRADAERSTQLDDVLTGVDGWTLAQLLEGFCALAVRATGLDWALSGRVVDGVWSPWGLYERRRDASTDQVRWASETAIALERLPVEAGVLASGLPESVDDARNDGRVHASLRRLLPASTYIVVAIMANGEPLGLLHAGRHGPRAVERADRDLLNDFARSIGRILDRADARQRLEAQRNLVQAACLGGVEIAASAGQEIDLRRLAGRTAPAVAGSDPFESSARLSANLRLTEREQEVLELLLLGLSNAAIAGRLVVAPVTVKSHVSNIMRKVGAVNRTELIALHYLAPEVA